MLRSALLLSGAVLGAVAQTNSTTTDPFKQYNLSAPGINATFIAYGARLTHLYVNDKNGDPQDVVLGYDDPHQYVTDTLTNHT